MTGRRMVVGVVRFPEDLRLHHNTSTGLKYFDEISRFFEPRGVPCTRPEPGDKR